MGLAVADHDDSWLIFDRLEQHRDNGANFIFERREHRGAGCARGSRFAALCDPPAAQRSSELKHKICMTGSASVMA